MIQQSKSMQKKMHRNTISNQKKRCWVFLRHCLAWIRKQGQFYCRPAAEPLVSARGTQAFRGTPVENHWCTCFKFACLLASWIGLWRHRKFACLTLCRIESLRCSNLAWVAPSCISSAIEYVLSEWTYVFNLRKFLHFFVYKKRIIENATECWANVLI